MKLHDKYVLRLANTSIGNEAPVLNTTRDTATIRLPNWLRNMGKCNVRVTDMLISSKNSSGASVFAASTRIGAIVCRDIPILGWSNEVNSAPIVLGSGIHNEAEDCVKLDSASALEFTCIELPSQVTLERMAYDPANGTLVAAKAQTAAVCPFQITMELTFEGC
tara:strand:+ start:1446 stop:1937 length:492 start_codon:yes stop_codon:yes gene_type:complete